MKYSFLHACIRVYDLEKSMQFYKDAFNFEVSQISDYPEQKCTLVYMKDAETDFLLELTFNYDSKPYDIGNGFSHLAVSVEDIEASYNKHKELGYEVTNIKKMSPESSSLYFVTDPDGYKVEIIED